MKNASLRMLFGRVRRRLVLLGTGRAVAWGAVGAVVLLLAGVWLDLLWDLPAAGRIATLLVAVGLGVGLMGVLVGLTLLAGQNRPVARRLDRTGQTGGAILTGWELEDYRNDGPHAELSHGMAAIAVDRAATLAAGVNVAAAVPARPLGRSMGTLAGLLLGVVVLALCLPDVARTQWNRFAHPTDDVVPYSPTTFLVTPGDKEVRYGDSLEIEAAVEGPAVEQAELVLEDTSGRSEALPMFPTAQGSWRAVLAKVTAETVYHVRSYGARSERYRITVITVPQIEKVRVRVTPPAYTRGRADEGSVPADGLAGLPGTVVEIWARSNRPLSGGTITLTPAAKTNGNGAVAAPPVDVPMTPVADGDSEVVGRFEITADGTFSVRVQDVNEQWSQESFTGTVSLLADHRPLVRILKPEPMSMATPNVILPVEISAEDDYGLSRVQLYRSLNDSRPMPADVPMPSTAPRRFGEQVLLPLRDYGLQPGDVIKLFARVEDNDPAGAKGAESSVVTVQIISQEEFERMLQLREGLEVLMSKYREGQRRLEGLKKKTEELQEKLRKQSPDSKASKETKEELRRMARRLRRESEALRKLADYKLDVDLDKKLGLQVEKVASMTDEMAEELEKLLKQKDLLNKNASDKIKEMAKRMGAQKDEYEKQAMMPLEHLEAVFPLLVDKSRFEVLVLRQRDLAERLAALKGKDNQDNPALKARMRDLEEEQRELRQELESLLDDIEEHVKRLPDDEMFDKLRDTASKYAKDLRKEGADEVMNEAEMALAGFQGTKAHEKAKEAADILDKFVKKGNCQGMGDCAGMCLSFQPTLGQCMGQSLQQLLAAMGFNPGSGMGSGMGMGMGGFSARRGYGLYGGLPGMGHMPFAMRQGRGPDSRRPGQFRGAGASADDTNLIEAPGVDGAAGASHAIIPPRFWRRVGQYHQRVAEETRD
ncbi:MAG: hypothetical protein JW818_03270 [Pirellulales bacterium]|nr:hypothetical protein [Pirellulales bacterium]